MATKETMTKQVVVRITEREKERWLKQAARERRRHLSDWIRVTINTLLNPEKQP